MTSLVLPAQDHAALIEAIARDRDRTAFAELFRYFAPRVKAYLRRLGAPDAVAEELAQETLLSVWRKADRYDATKAGASTWIFTIARNLRIDLLRREQRPDLDPEDPVLVPEAPVAADHALETQRRENRVRVALGHLPAEQAEVVRLAFFEDLTHADVAEKLGIPLGTVKSRLRLAFAKVRGHVGDDPS
ncbi:sigma-70 family RNA polymerase sigma factor [Pararhodospirillum photometricum]|nr:sigma-70 family RNA polymerase sigma factor [Pararhodospirillum photometricum]